MLVARSAMAMDDNMYDYHSNTEDMDDMADIDDELDEHRGDDALSKSKKIVYPPRLMVDFKSLGLTALQRYAQFYQLNVREDFEKDDLAAMVARHFDCSLEVEEDDSIVSFIQRVRNGEKSTIKRPSDKDRKGDKKRKKSSSRKRQRDSSVASTNSVSRDHQASTSSSDEKKAAMSSSSSSSRDGAKQSSGKGSGASNHNGGGSSGSSGHTKEGGSSKKSDDNNNEDNELYCICNLPSYGNMIACDGNKCPNPSQWYHWECVGLSNGRHPDTWLCPECDPKSFQAFLNKKKKNKARSKSPGPK
ncbi:TPA: hypothetical protein N0F65_011579 [Lagenidium giganteum]|uniref:PHD-type domain-containing protein n=1 Tax=Lagenidium giganteum TaxID=4803 RepID=A0AAV2YFP2_9STRA|nr:TPA: hypothetical protein N0F65_011579 [Lagenidium giganteum]